MPTIHQFLLTFEEPHDGTDKSLMERQRRELEAMLRITTRLCPPKRIAYVPVSGATQAGMNFRAWMIRKGWIK